MFPTDFIWGVAAAGYQTERPRGSADWDTFVNTPAIRSRVASFTHAVLGTTTNLTNPGLGIGHEDVNVVAADLDRARALGLNAYRFSVEWDRVQPDSAQSFDDSAIAHYLAVIEAILDRKMMPIISLNHMSLPLWVLTPPAATKLHDPFTGLPGAAEDDQFNRSLRGWETHDTVEAYGRFVERFVAEVNTLGERLDGHPRPGGPIWLTLNEPIGSMVGVGYLGAIWPPGFLAEADRGKRVCLNLVKAHVLAYRTIKQARPHDLVSFAHAMIHAVPTSFSPVAAVAYTGAGVGALGGALLGAVVGALLGVLVGGWVGAMIGLIVGAIAGAIAGGATGEGIGAIVGSAQNVHQRARDQFDYFINEWMLRALARGEIDTSLTVGTQGSTADWDGAWAEVVGMGPRGPHLDFIGINYYRRVHVYWFPPAELSVPYTGGLFHDNMEGDSDPHGLLNALGWEVYPTGLSSFLTRLQRDFGLPILITENGVPEELDANRAPNVVAHLNEVEESIGGRDSPQVLGYVHWTIVDNWEWHHGYDPRARFGLFSAGDRTPTDVLAIGLSTTFRRQLTEGALALRTVIQSRDIGPARSRFGAVSAGGERLDLPQLSNGALWEGMLAGAPIKLFLDTTDGGGVAGLLYYRHENAWLWLLDVGWDGGREALSFRHEALRLPPVPARSVEVLGLRSEDGKLRGAAKDLATGNQSQLTAARIWLHGVWFTQTAGSWPAIAVHGLDDGDPIGKRLIEVDRRWEAFRLTGTGPARKFDLITITGPKGRTEHVAFQLALTGDGTREFEVTQLSGPPVTPSPARFRRAPSSLTLLGEG